jgi:NADH-quinone oxidoreductase subunit M
MPWITAIVLVPLLGALSMLMVPPGGYVQARIHALISVGITAALTVGVVVRFDNDEAGLQLVDQRDWISSLGLSWNVGVDGLSLWLIVLTSGLFLLGVIAACWRLPERGRAFLALLLLAQAGLAGLFAAGDLVLFYVFWEAMLVPFYFLIGLWGNQDRRAAVVRFVVYTMAGSLLMLVAILGTAFIARDITGQFTFNIQELEGVLFTPSQSAWLFLGFAIAFAIKLPLFPFHGWLPRTYAAGPILVTALLAAVMSKAGAYGFMRVGVPVFTDGADRFAVAIGALAVVGIVYGSLLAWRAPTMRLLVAWSSLAHLGFIALAIVAFDLQASQGAVLQMINHGIVVAAAFAIVGIINRAAPSDRLDSIGGLALGAPRLAVVFLIVAMASLAIPGSNSFAGEFLLLTGTFRHHPWLVAFATLGIVYAALYMLRLYQSTMNGPVQGGRGAGTELRVRDYVLLAPLVVAMLVIALWPKGLVDATTPTLERTIAPAQIAAERPAEQITGLVRPNPPPAALPLPGDPPPEEEFDIQEPTP